MQSTQRPAQSPETRGPGPHPSRGVTEGAAPTAGRGRPMGRPSRRGRPGQGRAAFPALGSKAGSCGRPGLTRASATIPPRAGRGRHCDPWSPSGAYGPPGGAALFPETEPRERDTQPATGGRGRARPPSGRAWLCLSTNDKPPQTVTFPSWGDAQALTPQVALTPPGQPPQTPSACAVVPPTRSGAPTSAHAPCKPAPRRSYGGSAGDKLLTCDRSTNPMAGTV